MEVASKKEHKVVEPLVRQQTCCLSLTEGGGGGGRLELSECPPVEAQGNGDFPWFRRLVLWLVLCQDPCCCGRGWGGAGRLGQSWAPHPGSSSQRVPASSGALPHSPPSPLKFWGRKEMGLNGYVIET